MVDSLQPFPSPGDLPNPGIWGFAAISGIPWLIDTSLLSSFFRWCCLCVCLLMRKSVIFDEEFTLLHYDLILIKKLHLQWPCFQKWLPRHYCCFYWAIPQTSPTFKCEITDSKSKTIFQLLKCGKTCYIWPCNQFCIMTVLMPHSQMPSQLGCPYQVVHGEV